MVWIFNLARQDQRATIQVDLAKLGFAPNKPVQLYDAETGVKYELQNGQFSIDLPKRFWRALQIRQPKELTGTQSFIAHFDTDASADESLGNPLPYNVNSVPVTTVNGKTGHGWELERALSYGIRHHLQATQGSVSGQLYLDPTTSTGKYFSVANMTVLLASNIMRISVGNKNANVNLNLAAGAAWHTVMSVGIRVK